MSRQAANKFFAILASLLVLGLIASCSRPAPDEEEENPPPGGGTGGLYMHTGTNWDQGLFSVDSEDGAATKLGWGMIFHTGTSDVGLAGRGLNESLLGTTTTQLLSVPTTGAVPGVVADPCWGNGLAYDTDTGNLFVALGDFVRRVDLASCTELETISTDVAFGGLAIDSDNRTLYGIGDSDGNVYAVDLALGAPYVWTAMFDTGVTGWEEAGLAFDVANEVLYAVGHPTERTALFRINIGAGTIENVGDTGLRRAYGGLAWRYEDED